MKSVTGTALTWGLLIGLANLLWLYLAYYFGLHTSGIMVFQLYMLGWLGLSLAGYIFALRVVKELDPALTYGRGLGAGTTAAVISALVAVVAQAGYYKVIHPAWPDYMVQQTREHFTAENMAPEKIEQMVTQARETFTMGNYMLMSALTALLTGIVLSAIILFFMRRRTDGARA